MNASRQLLLIVCIALIGCGRSSTSSLTPIPSPDGSLQIVPSIIQSPDTRQNGCIAFKVVDSDGSELCSVQTKASNTMKWALRWHDDETVVLTSSDIGTRAWQIFDGEASELPLPLPPELLDPVQSLTDRKPSQTKKLPWPEASIGEWIEVTDDDPVSIRVENPRFQHMRGLPDEGYVPIEAMGPTVKATVHNDSTKYVAEVRIHLRAIGPAGYVIARDDTDDASGVYLMAPGEAHERTFLFDDVDTPLANSEKWEEFEISVDPVAARFVDPSDIGTKD